MPSANVLLGVPGQVRSLSHLEMASLSSHFRIVGASNLGDVLANPQAEMEQDDDHANGPATCLHGERLELFGDVCVEWRNGNATGNSANQMILKTRTFGKARHIQSECQETPLK